MTGILGVDFSKKGCAMIQWHFPGIGGGISFPPVWLPLALESCDDAAPGLRSYVLLLASI